MTDAIRGQSRIFDKNKNLYLKKYCHNFLKFGIDVNVIKRFVYWYL